MTIGLPKNVETRPDDVLKIVAYHEIGHTMTTMLFKICLIFKKLQFNLIKMEQVDIHYLQKKNLQIFPNQKIYVSKYDNCFMRTNC